MHGAVANDADIGLGEAEKSGEIGAGLLIIEGHHDDGTLALGQALHAAGKAVAVEAGRGERSGGERAPELFEEALLSLRSAAQVEHGHAANAENEGGEFFRLAEAAGAEGFEGHNEDLLGKVVGGRFVAQVAQAIKANARGHAAEQFGLGVAIAAGADLAGEISVGRCRIGVAGGWLGIASLTGHPPHFMCNGEKVRYTSGRPGRTAGGEVCREARRTRMIVNHETGTCVDEVASGIYRICTPLDVIPGGFTFNSYLIADDEPLLFHTGWRKLFPLTVEAVKRVMPVEKLRWIGGSHFEGDEFGALNDFLTAAPEATPFGSEIGVLTSVADYASRPARGLKDGEEFSIGSRRLQWLYTPHVPHGWDCGVLFDAKSGTLLCGDLFTQPGAKLPAVTESEVLTASEGMRAMMEYYAHATSTTAILHKLAELRPAMLACQHGSAFRGDSAALLRELAVTVEGANKRAA